MATGLSCGCTKSSFVSYQGRDNGRQICWVLSSLASLVQRHTIASRICFYGHINQRLHVMDTHNQSEPLYVSYGHISHLQLPVCVQTLNRNVLCECCDWNDCICARTNLKPERGHVTNSGLLLTVARLPGMPVYRWCHHAVSHTGMYVCMHKHVPHAERLGSCHPGWSSCELDYQCIIIVMNFKWKWMYLFGFICCLPG